MGRFFDGVMAVAAVHPQLASMQFVAERNWLFRRVTQMRSFRRGSGGKNNNAVRRSNWGGDKDALNESIDPDWKMKLVHD